MAFLFPLLKHFDGMQKRVYFCEGIGHPIFDSLPNALHFQPFLLVFIDYFAHLRYSGVRGFFNDVDRRIVLIRPIQVQRVCVLSVPATGFEVLCFEFIGFGVDLTDVFVKLLEHETRVPLFRHVYRV